MTSVPIDERTRDRLQQLRETIKRETGRSVTERELVARMVEREFESRDALVDSFRDGARSEDDDFEGLSDEEIERFFAGTSASGNPVDEDEIDRVLYEEEALPDAERR